MKFVTRKACAVEHAFKFGASVRVSRGRLSQHNQGKRRWHGRTNPIFVRHKFKSGYSPARLQRAVQFLQQVFIRGLVKVM